MFDSLDTIDTIIGILVGLCTLIGMGFGAWFYFKNRKGKESDSKSDFEPQITSLATKVEELEKELNDLKGRKNFLTDEEYNQNEKLKNFIIAYNNKNYEKAFEILEPIAEEEYVLTQFILGVMYENGQGVKQSNEEAIKWYKKAADQGDEDAQCNLGAMYANGQGVEQNYAEAFKWFKKAAKQGNAGAQFNFGMMYAKGHWVEQNDKEAFKWYGKAAEQGHATAQFHFGGMYSLGKGVLENSELAFAWLFIAKANGNELAKEILRKSEKVIDEMRLPYQQLAHKMIKENPLLLQSNHKQSN